MPVILHKALDISTESSNSREKEILQGMIEDFRIQVSDIDPELNVLHGKKRYYPDNIVVGFLKRGLADLNRGAPKTSYTLYNFPDKELLTTSAVIVALIAEGILQLRNQIDYSDSGFTVALFNKTGGYQSWAGMLLNMYLADKKDFKNSIIPRSYNSGFVSVSSQFGRYW